MMKRIVLAVAVVAFGVTAVVAQSDPIAARKALMKENGRQSGIARIPPFTRLNKNFPKLQYVIDAVGRSRSREHAPPAGR